MFHLQFVSEVDDLLSVYDYFSQSSSLSLYLASFKLVAIIFYTTTLYLTSITRDVVPQVAAASGPAFPEGLDILHC